MAKVYKIELYVADLNGDYDNRDANEYPEYIEELIENSYFANITRVLDSKASEKFEWDDDLEINKTNASNDAFEEYFRKEGE